ncbi:polysaccharide deacetylase family protein [Glutamicibacter protophormiae]|uniref:polysaccharide deacetylase family protein n=1 Tax=Glutamicibacter protophormiae TaxID=37930 RepID=UPI002A7F9450|nr:polysaccharide deacetylase family protein [Glutamicibacter protophormiae]WPR63297.1 polysaccharide deacetylase family protein [Glutamicibacter protophormiae]WPR66793.1 polysaccharide deacetylase family protein [Glutamicibacter protophormiae]
MPPSTRPAAQAEPTRRGLLRGALGLGTLGFAALTGCATPPEAPSGPQASPTPAAPPPNPAASPSATPPPAAAAVMTRAEAVAKYRGRKPGQFGLDVPGIQLGLPRGCKAAALSFDACGGPGGTSFDRALIKALRDADAPATLFVNQRWARANRSLLADLSADPLFEIANHGTSHAPLGVAGQEAYGIPGTASVGQAHDEIMGNQRYLAGEFGLGARFFRSGTAHMDQIGAELCRDLGLVPMNFTVNLDAGATFAASVVAAQVGGLRAGDVGIGHFNRPDSGTAAGVRKGLKMLQDAGVELVRLSQAW